MRQVLSCQMKINNTLYLSFLSIMSMVIALGMCLGIMEMMVHYTTERY